MQRCGIELRDGVVRIGMLCARCSDLAHAKVVGEGRRFWKRDCTAEACEVCHESDEIVEVQS